MAQGIVYFTNLSTPCVGGFQMISHAVISKRI